jgi:putative oxidoreductase
VGKNDVELRPCTSRIQVRIKNSYAALTLLLTRIALASNFHLFGALKFVDPQRIWDLCVAHGLPSELAYSAMILQLVGGLLILQGLQTHVATALFACFCIVAPSLFWLDDLENFTRDYATAGGFL